MCLSVGPPGQWDRPKETQSSCLQPAEGFRHAQQDTTATSHPSLQVFPFIKYHDLCNKTNVPTHNILLNNKILIY